MTGWIDPDAAAPQRIEGGGVRMVAPAKVNLHLHVVGRRPDGYHLLDSLVVFAGVGDLVEAEPSSAGLSLAVRGPFKDGLGAGEDNLVLRAAAALRRRLGAGGADLGASLLLEKRLPIASGLGGGSSDAAATLKAAGALWRARLEPSALRALALSLGADAPACLQAPTPTWMSGIGERLAAAPPLPDVALLLVNPGTPVSTPAVFAGLARRDGAPAPPPPPLADPTALASWLGATRNDLEAPAIAIAPPIAEVLAALRSDADCVFARMSGSGATCYGIFRSMTAAQTAAARLRKGAPHWWIAAAPMLRPA